MTLFRLHHGTLKVHSEIDKGAEFTITLENNSSMLERASLVMKNLLIVEDEPHVIRIMKLALEKNGYAVDVAHNGEQALEKLSEKSSRLFDNRY